MLSIFVMVRTSRKWKCFVQKESKPDDDYATQLKRQNNHGAQYMFPSVYVICMELFIHVICSNIYQKSLPKQYIQKSKLVLSKTMTRKCKNFKNTSTAIRPIQRYQLNQIISRRIHQWKISRQV